MDTEFDGLDNYSSQEKGLYLNVKSWKGKYTCFFHESGHALDDLLVDDGELSTTYSKDEVYLTNVLEADVRSVVTDSVDEKMIEQGIPEADRPKMIIINITLIAIGQRGNIIFLHMNIQLSIVMMVQ